jgi:hypothetical protein
MSVRKYGNSNRGKSKSSGKQFVIKDTRTPGNMSTDQIEQSTLVDQKGKLVDDAPVQAVRGVSSDKGRELKKENVRTVEDLETRSRNQPIKKKKYVHSVRDEYVPKTGEEKFQEYLSKTKYVDEQDLFLNSDDDIFFANEELIREYYDDGRDYEADELVRASIKQSEYDRVGIADFKKSEDAIMRDYLLYLQEYNWEKEDPPSTDSIMLFTQNKQDGEAVLKRLHHANYIDLQAGGTDADIKLGRRRDQDTLVLRQDKLP